MNYKDHGISNVSENYRYIFLSGDYLTNLVSIMDLVDLNVIGSLDFKYFGN